MTTSLDDLLTALDQASTAPTGQDAGDAAYALHWTHRLLERLRAEGVGNHPGRDDTIRRLADACQQAGVAFEHGSGRASDLAAVTCDTAGRLRRHLTDEDRWANAIRLAMPARRWARTIAAAQPSATPPQLLAVADRSRELLHIAAVSPPDLDAIGGLDLPIPSITPIDPAAAITQGLAALAGELHRVGRDPLTMRELIASCHAAYQVAAYTANLTRRTASPVTVEAHAAALTWRTVRETVALYTDSARPRTCQSQIMKHAVRLDADVRHTLASDVPDATYDLARVARHLHYVADASAAEMRRIADNLVVPHGPRPLDEDRVSEWLRRRTFTPNPPDLRPALEALHRSREMSATLARSMQIVMSSDVGSVAQRIVASYPSMPIGVLRIS